MSRGAGRGARAAYEPQAKGEPGQRPRPQPRDHGAPVAVHDPAARALFSGVFSQVVGSAGLDIRRQLIAMAAQLGEPRHVPALLEMLGEASLRDDERDQLLALIAVLTGFDRRYLVGGGKRPPGEVVAETLAACARSS